MKRLINTVELEFFCDDANGEYGLAHKETIDDNNGFNAFWSGIGMFHDIFEHSHEYKHKYFQGDYAMNLGGELAAMGSMWYYIDTLGISNRMTDNNRWRASESMRESTCGDVRESITEGYCRYGYSLESNVPKQRPVDNITLEDEMLNYWDKVKECEYRDRDSTDSDYDQEREFSKQYRESVSFGKIANLHRYGYRMAERLVPDNVENMNTLTDFIEFWDDFTKNNDAEELMNIYNGITVKIYKENGIVTWKAFLTQSNQYPDHQIRSVHNVLEDLWDYKLN